ncbi:MAG: hypothetical protein Q8N28_03040 [bacterium]|nr:hypothetical protein [bacterium]
MKKNIYKGLFIVLALIGLFGFLAIENPVFAAVAPSTESAARELAGRSKITTPSHILNILTKIVRYTYTIFFIVAIIFIIIAAFNFLTAQGDPEKIKGARAQILWAVVAIAIALISVGAAQIIQTFIDPNIRN